MLDFKKLQFGMIQGICGIYIDLSGWTLIFCTGYISTSRAYYLGGKCWAVILNRSYTRSYDITYTER